MNYEKEYQRQLAWCKKNFPIGSLVSWFPMRVGTTYYRDKINYGVISGYRYESLGKNLYLKLLSTSGEKVVNPGEVKLVQSFK